jgi:hypothetical protein
MRCPGCNKFVSYEEVDPEVDLSLDWSGDTPTISGSVRIVNACEDCGEELKEATFDIYVDAKVGANEESFKAHKEHELSVEPGEVERTCRSEGKGRGAKTFYGASVEIVVTCMTCVGSPTVTTVTWADEVQASSMDELV